MSRIALTPDIVSNTVCPHGKLKHDLFDTNCKGLLLEIRASGGKTWYIRWTNKRGKQRQYRIGDAQDLSVKNARKQADHLRGQIATGIDPYAARIEHRKVQRLTDFINEHYSPYSQGYKRSWHNDEVYFRLHIFPALGGLHLDEITTKHVTDFHHKMKSNGYAPATCNRCLMLLRHVFNRCLVWKTPGVSSNPTHGIPQFIENNKIERFLSQEETQKLLHACKESQNFHLHSIVLMLLLTGARKREVLDARWSEIDLQRKTWRIPTGKSGYARYVPISDALGALLRNSEREGKNEYLWPSPRTKKPFINIHYEWDKARIEANIPKCRMHDLRHSFASFLVNAGRSLYEVQKLLGHSQIRTTQRYAHLSQATLQEATNLVGSAITSVDSFQQK